MSRWNHATASSWVSITCRCTRSWGCVISAMIKKLSSTDGLYSFSPVKKEKTATATARLRKSAVPAREGLPA